MTAPDWLTQRSGLLKPTFNGRGWVVIFDDEPQYVVTPVPAQGKYGVRVAQTINGRQLPTQGKTFSSGDEAVGGGLEDLRQALGW